MRLLRSLPVLLPAILFGGLAGAVFTWYINRPQATTLAYTVTTTGITGPMASVDTSNPAIGGQGKTGQRSGTLEPGCL